MKPLGEPAHLLPAQRAFLVQVHAQAAVAQGQLAGRVEHVVSGQATHFASAEELLAGSQQRLFRHQLPGVGDQLT